MKTFAIVGLGSRGQGFANLIKADKNAKLVAIADPVKYNRELAQDKYGVLPENCYEDADAIFARGKLADAVFICTQDAQHKDMAIKAMQLGYDVMLEKPAATSIADCLEIRDTAHRLHKKVMLTHVLRYAPFFLYIKKLISEGKLGKIVNIEQTENIAHWHFALSYVRGPWRDMKASTPTIIAKCCHDLDIIAWLMDKKCTSVSSFGELFWYKKENAPLGSAEYCCDCSPETREKCLYNAYKIYPERINRSVVGGLARLKGQTIEDILAEKKDPISKCVFHSDNDAIDNQVVNMTFEDGTNANLTMTAFSKECYRTIHVHGTKGDVYGNSEEGILHVNYYGSDEGDVPEILVDVNKETLFNTDGITLNDGHGGGDYYLYKDFVNYITSEQESITRTTIDQSIESHVIGFKAEESRLQGGKVIKL